MYKILCLFLITSQLFAQDLQKKLMGDWIKQDIRLSDGSPILKPEVKEVKIRYVFKDQHNIQITVNGKTGTSTYKLKGDTLQIGKNVAFKIQILDDISLVIKEITADSSLEANAIKISFIPARIHNLGFFPEKYLTKGKDTIYISKPYALEPFFIDPDKTPSEYISERFFFPEYKAGDFYTRFIITKTGEIKGIEILSSTHPTYNNRLIEAIKKTSGKWVPATWEGQPVNTEVKMGFDLGWSEKMAEKGSKVPSDESEDHTQESNYYLEDAKILAEQKNYAAAIRNYSKSIELNPFNIDAYYGRASMYALKKDTKKMCEDLLQLKNLEQVKGTQLWNKFCVNKETPNSNPPPK